jgi:hypothetical protein
MNSYAERVADLRTHAKLPGGELSAELRGDGGLLLEWAPGYYYRADDREVAAKLESLARLLSAARMRRAAAFIRAEGGEIITGEHSSDPLDKEYFRRLTELLAEGFGCGRRIHLRTLGMRDWTVRIEPGTVQSLQEYQFTSGVAEAARCLWRDQLNQVGRLKEEVYGSGRV